MKKVHNVIETIPNIQACDKGASSWLNALPIQKLNKFKQGKV